ncbi:thioredoxin-related protein [Hydrogenivirga caldilitoris]|uniref:Thioredoxin-related protein n=1 Tax=Hydrogenivirga caldilitoris TaxID=246264 RepID=A0A497XT47_9AQUI|nr:thioredoxin family protein [Hydrogenivirga caldilitoris]RLJ71441.1 thioredoxin-related protein [Hydrogenivirga caldilitoris]
MLRILVLLIIGISTLSSAQVEGWVTDFKRGVELAKAQGKEVLLYFYGEHCPYCLQMEEFVLGDPDVDRYIRERFIVVSLNINSSEELNRKFGVYGTPHFVIYDPNYDRIVLSIFGSREREDFLNLLTRACKKTSLRRC